MYTEKLAYRRNSGKSEVIKPFLSDFKKKLIGNNLCQNANKYKILLYKMHQFLSYTFPKMFCHTYTQASTFFFFSKTVKLYLGHSKTRKSIKILMFM